MNKKVWVNGCFDILHAGHIALLLHAKSLGDVYIGIDSDRRIKRFKGSSRPILPQEERALILSSLVFIKKVNIFNSDKELIKMIKDLSPDYIVVGEEYMVKRVIGGKYAKKTVFYPRIGDWSTSKIVTKIKSSVVKD